jgi:CheY-like chemotaxis protein
MSRGGYFSIDSLAGRHVLLVESGTGRVVGSILRYCGALITAVMSREAALRMLDLVTPDVLVIDVTGITDAFELLREIRERKPEHGGTVRAVAITPPAVAEKLRATGCDASVVVPLDPWDLCRTLSGLLLDPIHRDAALADDTWEAEWHPACSGFRSAMVKGDLSADLLAGIHVLVVDDDADARHLVRTILEYCGALVTSAGSAAEALQVLERVTPDVLLSDIAMPGEDGYWLIRHVRALPRERGGAVPAVALTAHGQTHGPDRTLSAGFHLHLRKPVDPWELCRALAALSRRD